MSTAWNHIVSKADADKLLDIFGGFHDGCLREVHIWTQSWVAPDLRMQCASDLDTRIRFYVQRQFRNPSAIELLFEQVVGFHLQPSAQNYDSIIFGATLLFDGDIICWADAAGWSPTDDMSDTEFHWDVWLITLTIGLPMLAFVVWKRWKQAQSGFFWRAVLCLIIACIITPFYSSEDFGGIITVDIMPAVAVVPSVILGMIIDGGHGSLSKLAELAELAEFLEALILSLFPILVVSGLLAGVWSMLIRSRWRRQDDVA